MMRLHEMRNGDRVEIPMTAYAVVGVVGAFNDDCSLRAVHYGEVHPDLEGEWRWVVAHAFCTRLAPEPPQPEANS